MNIILFGPPGVGKSTLIGTLKLAGSKAIDLEDVFPSSIRFQLPSMVDGVVFGGADLNPARSYNNAIKIVLTMPQDDYDKRRMERDSKKPGKGNQQYHLMYKWKNIRDALDVDARGTPDEVLKRIDDTIKQHYQRNNDGTLYVSEFHENGCPQ